MKPVWRAFFAAVLAAGLCACAPAAESTAPPTPEAAGFTVPLHSLTEGTEKGRYTVGWLNESWDSAVLSWIDYATLQSTPFCTVPACPHKDRSCPAYLGAYADRVQVQAFDEQRLLARYRYGLDAGNGPVYQELALCRADGSEALVLISDTDAMDLDPVAADSNALWYMREVYAEELQTIRMQLCRVPLAGGEPQILGEWGWDTHYLGCHEQSLVLLAVEDGAADSADTTEEPPRTCRLLLVDGYTGGTTLLQEWQAAYGGTVNCYWQADTLYRMDAGTDGALELWNIDGTVQRFPVPLPMGHHARICGMVGDHIVLHGWDAEGDLVHCAAVDVRTGEIKPLTLSYVINDSPVFLDVLAATKDCVLVEFERQQNGEHVPHIRCGLLTFEEYLNNIPNYQEIMMLYGDVYSTVRLY